MSETPMFDTLCKELGDPFDTNSESSVALWVASEKAREDLEAFKSLVRTDADTNEIQGLPQLDRSPRETGPDEREC